VLGVFVSHPHANPVSVAVAAAFARAGQLAAYFTGVAFGETGWTARVGTALAQWKPVLANRVLAGVPTDRLRPRLFVDLGARAPAPAAQAAGLRLASYDALFAAHDAAVAALPWPRDARAAYVYEDAALLTFRRAARAGLARFLDVSSLHHLTVEEIWQEEGRRWPGATEGPIHVEPEWKRRRKAAEAAIATRISVASDFTRASLERAGVTAPIITTPYGFPVDLFPARTQRPAGPFTVLAVGAQNLLKGTPYLLEAWKRAAIPNAELHLVGRVRLSKSFLDGYAGTFRHWPHVPRRDLAARYAAADVVVFPTLGDGFGLVIQEAMCCATPVVTTPCGGGPACITDGVDGWIVPARDADALVERLRAAAADRDQLFEVGRAARARAERWTWREAGAALIGALVA
jgi:glycosyltransferase involved in cell wall biosynthesis